MKEQLADSPQNRDETRADRRAILAAMMRDSAESGGYEATCGPAPTTR